MMRAQTENTSSLLKEHRLHGPLVPDARSQMLKSTEELDTLKNLLEGVNLFIWDKFCFLRKAKVESELQVKKKKKNQVTKRQVNTLQFFYYMCQTGGLY